MDVVAARARCNNVSTKLSACAAGANYRKTVRVCRAKMLSAIVAFWNFATN